MAERIIDERYLKLSLEKPVGVNNFPREQESLNERITEWPERKEKEQSDINTLSVEADIPLLDKVHEYGIDVSELNQLEKEELLLRIKDIKNNDKFSFSALLKGNLTATKYDSSEATNFSTITNNVVLDSGRELFVIYNYRFSSVHRSMDTLLKKMVGLPMKKASYKEWPDAFRKKSLLPVFDLVENDGNVDKNVIILERIPNINVYDLITNFDFLKNSAKQIDDCDFVKNMSKDGLQKIINNIAYEVGNIHNDNKTWGDLVPSNIIIDKNQKIHICDPETIYDRRLSIDQQKAYDLLEFTTSFSTVMNREHQIPHKDTISKILKSYGEVAQNYTETISELKKISEKKFSLINNLAFGYLMGHLSVRSKAEYLDIMKEINNCCIESSLSD